MRPRVRILLDGQDITGRFEGRAIEVTITDAAGTQSDTAEIAIDDVGGSIAAPRTGAKLAIEGGYEESGLVRFGLYVVDQVDYEGWPQRIVISARSADNLGAQKVRRTEAHEKTTLGGIAGKVADRHGLQAAVEGSLAASPIPYEAQAEESDLAFLSRLAARYDATMKIGDGRLVLVPRASGKSTTGKELPQLVLRPGRNLISYQVSRKEKPKHGKAKAAYFNRKKATREVEEEPYLIREPTAAGASTFAAAAATSDDDSDTPYLIREPQQDQETAKVAAKSAAQRLARGAATATFVIVGDPGVVAEVPVRVEGVRDQVDGIWSPKTVTHAFTPRGYTTSLECEAPA